MANFPTLTTKPAYGAGGKLIDNTIRVDIDGGYDQTRKRYTRDRRQFEYAYDDNMPDSDKYTLKTFELSVGCHTSFTFQAWDEAYGNNAWQSGHVYAVGDIVRPVTANGRSYKCTQAGTSDSVEPTWPTTANATVADNTVVWTENTYTAKFSEPIDYTYQDFGYSGVKMKLKEA